MIVSREMEYLAQHIVVERLRAARDVAQNELTEVLEALGDRPRTEIQQRVVFTIRRELAEYRQWLKEEQAILEHLRT